METVLFAPEDIQQEYDDMGSYNHSMVQANLAYLFKLDGKYSVFNELSLDVSHLDSSKYAIKDEVIPDVCIYSKRSLIMSSDILKMTEMPLLVVEILSPRQWVSSILEKFQAYFDLGIKSCWLVDPLTRTVHVYQSYSERTTYGDDTVSDSLLDIQMPLAEIFEP